METQSTEAKGRILAAAIETIDAEGDAALRITDIAQRAGVATGLINHHFGSRDGLVAAAQAERFKGLAERDIETFIVISSNELSDEQVADAVRVMCDMLASCSRAEFRMRRVSAVGAAHGRPELQSFLANGMTELLDAFSNVIVEAQSRNVVRNDIEARTLATIVLAGGIGLIVADLDTDPVSEEQLSAAMYRLVTGN